MRSRTARRLLSPWSILLLVAFLAAPNAGAWHTEDELENARHGTKAGDPRLVEDAEACLEDTQDRDGTTCSVHYVHFGEQTDDNVMNLQRPPDCAPAPRSSILHPVGAPPLVPGLERIMQSHHRFIHYALDDDPCEMGASPGPLVIRDDVRLDDEIPITGFWYLSSDTAQTEDEATTFGAILCMSVHMALRTGTTPGQGEPIAEGQTTKSVVTPPGPIGNTSIADEACPEATGTMEAETVTEFQVDLGTAKRDLRHDEGHHLHVQVHQWRSDGDDDALVDQIIQHQWRQHAGADHPNRIILPVLDFLQVSTIETHMLDDTLFVHARFESPWGRYDLDTHNLQMHLFDHNNDPVPLKHVGAPLMTAGSYASHHGNRSITFPWDYQEEDLEPGTYTIRLTGANWQHTATATGEITIQIAPHTETEDAPFAPLLVLAAALIALGLHRRPQHHPPQSSPSVVPHDNPTDITLFNE